MKNSKKPSNSRTMGASVVVAIIGLISLFYPPLAAKLAIATPFILVITGALFGYLRSITTTSIRWGKSKQ